MQLAVSIYANNISTVLQVYREFFQIELIHAPFTARHLSVIKPVDEVKYFVENFSRQDAHEQWAVKLFADVVELYQSRRITLFLNDILSAIREIIRQVNDDTFESVISLLDICLK